MFETNNNIRNGNGEKKSFTPPFPARKAPNIT